MRRVSNREAPTSEETAPEALGHPANLPLQSVVGDRYVVLSVLGSGGMGTVYRARHQGTLREVALKVLHASLHDRPLALRRFDLEARVLATVSHPHINPTLDAGVDAGTGLRYQTSSLLEGESLREIVRRECPLAIEHTLRLVLPVLSALEAVHAAGIVHRDVKPENIHITQGDDGAHPWLLDFGVCGHADADTFDTQVTALVGTPAYMAPEQAAGGGIIDARADVWAVGVLLFELLTGCQPFHDALPGVLLARILTEDAPPIATLRPDLPPTLAACIDRALLRDRTKRHPSARAFAEALLDAAAAPSLRTLFAESRPRDAPDTQGPAKTASMPRYEALPLWKHRRLSLAVLGAIVAIAAITGTWASSARRTDPGRSNRVAPASGSSLAPRMRAPLAMDAAPASAADAAVAEPLSAPHARERPARRPRRAVSHPPSLRPYEVE